MSIATVLEQRINSLNEKINNLDFGANAAQRWYMKSFLYASLEVTLKAEKVSINILPSKDLKSVVSYENDYDAQMIIFHACIRHVCILFLL